MRLRVILVFVVAMSATAAFAGPPTYDPRVVQPIGDVLTGPHGQVVRDNTGDATKGTILDSGACVPDSTFDTHPTKRTATAGMYTPDQCRRLRIIFGPIVSKPGQDDVLIQPVTFEKPMYDGYVVRFKPTMVDALGATPPVEQMHLHHGTWLNVYPSYGSGPWIASGEEKTIVPWPYRYGLKVGAADSWLFLHMVHNATPKPTAVFVQYDIDFIPNAKAVALQPDGKPLITNTKGLWSDVGSRAYGPGESSYFLNPIFNIQKGYGAPGSDSLGRPTNLCRWPDRNCSMFSSMGVPAVQQGIDSSDTIHGQDITMTEAILGPTRKGTIIMSGGHTHNGGIRTELELVRGDEAKLISNSEAYYWQKAPYTDRIGAPPISWDYSQTGSTLDVGWAVDVKVGDKLRLNGVYETDIASWYEQMGIVMSWVVPGGIDEGIDVFAPGVTVTNEIPVLAAVPNDAAGNALVHACVPSETNLCARGQISHGPISSSGNHGTDYGCTGSDCGFDWTAVRDGQNLSDIAIGGFTYGLAEAGVARTTGVPTVTLGKSVSFHNVDTADYMWHTVTRCALPCTGSTTVDYPIADGGAGPADPMDFDSTQLGVGTGPTQRTSWTFTPTERGTFAFFCRVHPSMRGVLRVK